MQRMLLTIAYDGTAYHGWQVQKNGVTVQATVQDGLEKLLGFRPGLTGCSRTDAGVHAREFCCHFDCEAPLPEKAFTSGLNALLPADIAVKACREVPADFHARYSATGKTYGYYILNSAIRDPFSERYSWRIARPLDTDRMNQFCKTVLGRHDFAPFSSSGRSVEDTVRTVRECMVTREGETVKVSVTADGFLYNMVRILVGTAVEVSFGRIPADAEMIFRTGDRTLAGETAPPHGLFLEKVHYGEDEVKQLARL